MSRYISRRDFIKGTAAGAVGMVITSAGLPAFSEEKGIYTPGTYSASAAGFESEVTVKMTFDLNAIIDVAIDVSGETPEVGGAIGETMAKRFLAAQSAEIDAVSGATATSAAVKTAAKACIAQAKGETVRVAAENEEAAKAGKKFSMELNSGWYMYAFFGGTGMQFGLNEDGVTNFCNWNTIPKHIFFRYIKIW